MRLISAVGVVAFVVVPRISWGQVDPTPATGAPTVAPTAPTTIPTTPPVIVQTSDAKLWIGGGLDLMPLGTLHETAMGMSSSADTDTAIAFGGLAEYRVSPLVTLGFAPRIVLNIKTANDTDSGKQIDLRPRVTVGKEVAPRFRLFGIGVLGYSILFLPPDTNGNTYHPHGLIIGFGAGLAYNISPRLLFTGELSYQLGYQSTTAQGVDVGFGDDYLTLGVGLLAAID